MYLEVDHLHTNREGMGFCCPHCLQMGFDGRADSDEWQEVKCSECGEPFAIRGVVTVEGQSGVINDRIED